MHVASQCAVPRHTRIRSTRSGQREVARTLHQGQAQVDGTGFHRLVSTIGADVQRHARHIDIAGDLDGVGVLRRCRSAAAHFQIRHITRETQRAIVRAGCAAGHIAGKGVEVTTPGVCDIANAGDVAASACGRMGIDNQAVVARSIGGDVAAAKVNASALRLGTGQIERRRRDAAGAICHDHVAAALERQARNVARGAVVRQRDVARQRGSACGGAGRIDRQLVQVSAAATVGEGAQCHRATCATVTRGVDGQAVVGVACVYRCIAQIDKTGVGRAALSSLEHQCRAAQGHIACQRQVAVASGVVQLNVVADGDDAIGRGARGVDVQAIQVVASGVVDRAEGDVATGCRLGVDAQEFTCHVAGDR